MKCPKCQCENVNINTAVELKQKSKKGCAYWLFVGWWLEPMLWFFLTLPKLIVFLFGNKKKTVSQTVTYAVCQKCGYRWKIQG